MTGGHAILDRAHDFRRAKRRAAIVVALAVPGGAAGGWLVALGTGAPLWVALPLGAWLGFLLAAEALRGAPGLPILTYRSVSEDAGWLPGGDEMSIRPETLDAHLRLIRRMGLRILDTEETLRARRQGLPVPRDALCLHFDDGYLDTWVAAWPILQKHHARATVFVATDFVAPDEALRPTAGSGRALRWDGYMTWRELRMLEAGGTFRVELQGTDRGRVASGPVVLGHLTPASHDREAWMQWAETPGAKHDWYEREPVVPFGTPVPESAPALTVPAWRNGRLESERAYESRVRATFRECRKIFEQEMGRAPALFAWPEDTATPRARALATEAGFLGTTAGQGRNTDTEAPEILGRVRAGQDHAGFRAPALDDLWLRAQLRCCQGHLAWAPVLAGFAALHGVVSLGRRLTRRTTPASAPLTEETA